MGKELQGRNVKYFTNRKFACYVDDNKYDIFEVPKTSNIRPAYGDFLVLAYDSSFDYWVLSDMNVKLNEKATKELESSIYETVKIDPYGYYSFGNEVNPTSVRKIAKGGTAENGGPQNMNILFGSMRRQKNCI